jgi:hypothetical protein
VGRSRTDSFSREGQQILLVAGVDQKQIILVVRREGWILLCSTYIAWVDQEWILLEEMAEGTDSSGPSRMDLQ